MPTSRVWWVALSLGTATGTVAIFVVLIAIALDLTFTFLRGMPDGDAGNPAAESESLVGTARN